MGSVSAAASDLTGLYSIFRREEDPIPRARFVAPDEAPEPFRSLLAHDDHMTVSLERHHGGPVALIVIRSVLDGHWYARKVLLTERSEGRVILFGIMRFNFDWCGPEVRQRIVGGREPLGRILIEHDVLRRISTHALMKIHPNQEMRDVFALGREPSASQPDSQPVYGRLATIFCNHEPAVDLLEVLSPFH
jgi:hypothetical protein